jgi:hypothetical protein
MSIIVLSKRDSRYQFVKSAGRVEDFLAGAADEAKEKSQVMSAPFKTILSTVGPFLFSKTIWGWALWELAQHFGFDVFGWIGGMADKMLGLGKSDNPPSVGESDIKSAAEGISDGIWDWLKSKWNEILDYITGVFASSDRGIVKQASKSKWTRFMRQVGSGRRVGLVGFIYKLLMVAFLGLAGSIGFSGLFRAVGLGPSASQKEMHEREQEERAKTERPVEKHQHYQNTKNNIEDTLIYYLNTAVGANEGNMDMETYFQMTRSRPLRGSPEMQKILKEIHELYRYSSTEEINNFETFYGPKVKEIIGEITPEVMERHKQKQQVPAEPKEPTKPTSRRVKKDPKKELKQLLEGVFNE